MQENLIDLLEEHEIPYIVSISDFNAFAGHQHLNRLIAANTNNPSFSDALSVLKRKMEAAVYASLKRLKQRGWKRGEFDICIPVPSVTKPTKHSLYMDLKRGKNGKTTEEQEFNATLYRKNGSRVEFPRSDIEAWKIVCEHCGVTDG